MAEKSAHQMNSSVRLKMNRSDDQVVSVTDCSVKRRVFEPRMIAGFQYGERSLHRPTF